MWWLERILSKGSSMFKGIEMLKDFVVLGLGFTFSMVECGIWGL